MFGCPPVTVIQDLLVRTSPERSDHTTDIMTGPAIKLYKASEFFAERQQKRDDMTARAEMNPSIKTIDSRCTESEYKLWYERDGKSLYLKVIDQPGFLSGNILRRLVPIPPLETHSEIVGDTIRAIPQEPRPLEIDLDDDIEDITEELQAVPIIEFDQKLHFAKRCRYKSEITNLLKVKGLSPNIIELLGRTDDGRLVFPLCKDGFILGHTTVGSKSLLTVKRWSVELADAVCILHSHGIIHRDLELRNILATSDCQTVVLCDLEGRWGSDRAPELRGFGDKTPHERPYTKKTDVYGFGFLLTNFILGNNPRSSWAQPEAPEPFASIARACWAESPDDRPTMEEVKARLLAIDALDDL
ncbi:hypothetical protein H2248_011243 [Termitomyces sp. 'cryptogamus']|nr:hypothetical protein H2248_011243 [Termitomyces sp. 'cryptogamus']